MEIHIGTLSLGAGHGEQEGESMDLTARILSLAALH